VRWGEGEEEEEEEGEGMGEKGMGMKGANRRGITGGEIYCLQWDSGR